MPSFLSKVFGRKKDDKESPRSPGRVSDPDLLDGKFESVSPSATKFPEVVNGKDQAGQLKEKDASFTLFRAKSPTTSPTEKRKADVPHLSLNLHDPLDDPASRTLGAVFGTDLNAQVVLSDSTIDNRRLSPLETLSLVQACSQVITARGLESLGIMHPHWYSASPEAQRRLISLFIQSLAPKSPKSTLAQTPPADAFESELSSTRSAYDVAAVLRWGLRHLQLEGDSFGKERSWYSNFFEAERSAQYPQNGFSVILAPTLPPSHLKLLDATLEVFSSLAAHAEANGISGSKLSKFFGLWLLTVPRIHDNDDWTTFYANWERAGRILEHLFLSRIRDEAVRLRMPTRLLELVHQYPYNKNTPDTDILPRPRFSTRQYDALFIRIETDLPEKGDQPAYDPLRLISAALQATTVTDAGQYATIWEIIRKAGADGDNNSPGAHSGLGHIFADETLRLISLIPTENGRPEPDSPSFNFYTRPSGRRSFSLDGSSPAASAVAAPSNGLSGHTKPANDPVVSPSTPLLGTDWITFSTSGFLESSSEKPLAATLLDKQKDMEVTLPKTPSPRSKVSNGHKPLESSRATRHTDSPKSDKDSLKTFSRSTHVSLVQLDEAFIDFWSDALLDPISSTWPAFVICKLKNTLPGIEVDGKRIEWLVVEQTYKRPAPTPTSSTHEGPTPDSARRNRASSPNSFRSEATINSVRKRFSFFTSGRTSTSSEKATKTRKGAAQTPRIGEMGEILAEMDEGNEREKERKGNSDTVRVRIPSPKPRMSVDVTKKSVDVTRRSIDVMSKTPTIGQAAGAAAVMAGAAAIATVVSTDGVTPGEPLTPADMICIHPGKSEGANGHANEAAATSTSHLQEAVEPAPAPQVVPEASSEPTVAEVKTDIVEAAAPIVPEPVSLEPTPVDTVAADEPTPASADVSTPLEEPTPAASAAAAILDKDITPPTSAAATELDDLASPETVVEKPILVAQDHVEPTSATATIFEPTESEVAQVTTISDVVEPTHVASAEPSIAGTEAGATPAQESPAPASAVDELMEPHVAEVKDEPVSEVVDPTVTEVTAVAEVPIVEAEPGQEAAVGELGVITEPITAEEPTTEPTTPQELALVDAPAAEEKSTAPEVLKFEVVTEPVAPASATDEFEKTDPTQSTDNVANGAVDAQVEESSSKGDDTPAQEPKGLEVEENQSDLNLSAPTDDTTTA
ncbi:hypothetical protein H0H81_009602 [Sphagnurus paluster]|uniref:Meiotically up-regulated protein Msb1/Mug8 domain-containing protein n=1 Tax=Sphagnurus paluster TaxID=117069 RepID=A0A9P7K5C1_9AGAR|nr:hypothetical protein H0H81_009602 [Sphagnurus paluster]